MRRIVAAALLSLAICSAAFSQESPLDVIFTNLDLIELSADNLQRDLMTLSLNLEESERNLQNLTLDFQNVLENYLRSEQDLENVRSQLRQASEKSEQLERRQESLESRLLFYRIITPVLGLFTAASMTVLILSFREK